MTPTMSVIMATHNNAKFLRDAMDSILNQTFSEFEFIIIDDASTDATPRILDDYTDSRIVRIRNESNLKLGASLNRGISIASTDLIARMDDDDISYPKRLERQLSFIRSHPDIDMVGTSYNRIDATGRELGQVDQPASHGLITWQYLSRQAYPICHPTILAKRKLLVEAGGYNEDFAREQDGELFLRLIHSARFANLPEHLYAARVTRSSQSANDNYLSYFDLTVEIRRRCLSIILDRDVTAEEVKRLVYPEKRTRRQSLNIQLSTENLNQAIQLLLEIKDNLQRKSYVTSQDVAQLNLDLSRVIMQSLSLSEEYLSSSSRNFSAVFLLRLLVRRITDRISHPDQVTRYIGHMLYSNRRVNKFNTIQ